MSGPVVGIGMRPGALPGDLAELVARLERAVGTPLRRFATLDRRVADVTAALRSCRPEAVVEGVAAEVLAAVEVPHPSAVVGAAVGTGSVAEAAALAVAAGTGRAKLLVPKLTGSGVTGAVAVAEEE
ncbi:cobalamin biosynthesis protein [Rhodococcus sp. D2-41]|uniref:Cobalamin biosynthesis protein n=1 Tax=Speluncibacter jeojiensis TaxID=2710754 RepID=A0A9X4LX23_9ACTN|nr:cobalamin biosynthesis protein [Rhodococcus sp. D2-41]MDG3010960.1 cobalamin biosynthesis protein [Rhodococcus sp. D2-41]MDG3013935.1 cobalamin biosynthesis protein [Corynebacteriales bacterium D3-21]